MQKTVLAILLIMCATISYAQSIVPRAGLTLSTVSVSDDDEDLDLKSVIGFTIGAGFNFPVSEIISLQPELNFIRKGFKGENSYHENFDGYEYSEDSEAKVALNYLEVPVLAKFSFGGETKFFLIAGPSFGIGLGGKAKEKYSYVEKINGQVVESESDSETTKVKFGDASEEDEAIYFENRLDLGLQFGAGVLIKNRIAIEARYGLGLSSLVEDTDVMNRVVQFSVAMPFSLSK